MEAVRDVSDESKSRRILQKPRGELSWRKLAAPDNIVGISMLLRSATCSPAKTSFASMRGVSPSGDV